MKIKKVGISAACGCIVALAFIIVAKFGFTEYSLSYSVEYEEAGDTQLFYADDKEMFAAENMVASPVESGKVTTIEKSMEKEDHWIRIDLGYLPNDVQLTQVQINALGMKLEITDDLRLDQNEIADVVFIDGIYSIKTEGEDPYIVFDVEPIIQQIEQRKDFYNYILYAIYLIIGFLTAVVIYVKFNKAKGLFKWLFDILKEWRLIWRLALNDFKMRYVTSYLGTIWAFVQPIVTVTIYVIVFGMGFKSLPVEGVSFSVFLTTGIVPWFFFQEAWISATNSLLEYSYLVKKVVFKINILPMVKITASVFVHLFFIVLAIGLQSIYGMPLRIQLIQIPYYLFCMMVLILGVSYITSALVVFLKDIGQIVSIVLQFGMWLTPIMYRSDMFGPVGERILKVNPMFYIVDGYRDAFFQQGWFWEKPGLTLYFWCFTAIILLVGIKVFKGLEKHFADVL